jgi:hypothetical protein
MAIIPTISREPRLAAIKEIPVIHAGREWPAVKKSSDVFIRSFNQSPIPTTKAM